jgi:uncharacterized phiE125 gp8 family phage protein
MPQILITPPAVEPVSLHDLKLQCGLSPVEDTDHVKEMANTQQLRRFIRTARAMCEDTTRRVFITQTWQMLLDGWPRVDRLYQNHGHHPVLLPKQPFQSLGDFTYVDTQGIVQPMSGWGYQLDPGSDSQPARLNPPYLMPWPPTRLIPNNISITFTCGYGATGASVPQPILDAILLLAQFFRDGYPMEKEPPPIVNDMLGPYINRVS